MDLKEYKKAKQGFMKNAQGVIAGEFQEFFSKHPEIIAIRWTQYTPHFNDGDVCKFSRHEFDSKVTLNEKKRGEVGEAELIIGIETDEEGFYGDWELEKDSPLAKAIGELDQTFSDTDDVFKSAFGDGVQVVASRKGFKIEDYDHD